MKTIYLLVGLAAFAACALIVYHRRKQWEKFFLARGFRPTDVNDISARVGGAMAALFTPGKGLYTHNSFGGAIAGHEAFFVSFANNTGPMRAAVFFSSESGPSGQLGENLSAQCIGPWVVFLSQEPVKLGDAEAWLAAVDTQVHGMRL